MLLALLDHFNHEFYYTTDWQPTIHSSTADINNFAADVISPGQPISVGYGSMDTAQFLLLYGFLPPNNPFDQFRGGGGREQRSCGHQTTAILPGTRGSPQDKPNKQLLSPFPSPYVLASRLSSLSRSYLPTAERRARRDKGCRPGAAGAVQAAQRGDLVSADEATAVGRQVVDSCQSRGAGASPHGEAGAGGARGGRQSAGLRQLSRGGGGRQVGAAGSNGGGDGGRHSGVTGRE
ncbi:unnamed protein product [Closterium sp. NIES-53]